MNRKTIIAVLLSGTLVLAGVFAVLAYSVVKAAAPAAEQAITLFHGRGFGGYSDDDLAEALGISVDELNSAMSEATDAALEQAVSEGLLTQDQADQIRERGAAFPFGRGWNRELGDAGIDYDALLAEALGISTDELHDAYLEAATIAIDRAVAEGNLTEEQADLLKGQNALYSNENFQTSMQNAFTEAVNQAVSDGVITQAQADQILENATNAGSSGFWGMRGLHGSRGSGRHGGWGGETPPGLNQPTQESTPTNEG